MNNHRIKTAVLSLFLTSLVACGNQQLQLEDKKIETTLSIPVAGNSWIDNNVELSDKLIDKSGVTHWFAEQGSLSTYFYTSKTGELAVSLQTFVKDKPATIEVSIAGQSKIVTVKNNQPMSVPVGTFNLDELGYQKLTITGLEQAETLLPAISEIKIGGEVALGKVSYVKDDFYWGRRGPSVHLQYSLPSQTMNYPWFYSEIEVPKGADAIGSYYMANGFDGGYFGIQVNSDSERRVLFSIWSPFSTDDPSLIPPEYRIQTLKHGKNVHVGKFGNEGSGGQSYMRYDWKADTRYGFLTHIRPVEGTESTDFTAYFYDPMVEKWQLIASFRRPKTSIYHQGTYSFLENFIPGAGQFERRAIYTNQWAKPERGEWQEVTQAKFTYDATAKKNARFDYQGGTTEKGFYLKNTGFFSAPTPYGSEFERSPTDIPKIDLKSLP
ncbi:DUF3472 domain-containing protein [Pseudoalteromonas lipolytica]|uniref:DUF3472 domain-containing protein n=1 Tax=Pseudoalteromonas lipolytica TaxID=570156 RepID=UPI0006CA17B3|nr:DUF3472 domain-containing protein [Pseudoalteromonas lipolytica]